MCISERSQPRPQDGPWSWLVLFVVWFTNLVVGGIVIGSAVMLPTLRDYFKKSRQSTAWVVSIATSMLMFWGPLTGLLINRFGCRAVAMFGAALCSAGLLTTSFAKNLEFMYFSYGIVFGCGSSFAVLTCFVVVTNFFTKWRSLAVGISAGGLGSGGLVFGPSLEALMSAVGWRNTFKVLSGITVIILFIVCVFGPKEIKQDIVSKTECIRMQDTPKRQIFDCSVWTNRRWAMITLATGFSYFAKAVGQVNLAQHAKDSGISDEDFAKLYLFIGLAGTFSRPAGGLLCQVNRIKALFVLLMSIALLGVMFLLLPILSSYRLLALFAILFGVGDGLLVTSTNVAGLKCFEDPVKKTSGYGILMMWASVAFAIGPPLSGHMADVYGTFNPSFYLAGVCCVLAAVIICFIPCLQKNRNSDKDDFPVEDDLDTTKHFLVYETAV